MNRQLYITSLSFPKINRDTPFYCANYMHKAAIIYKQMASVPSEGIAGGLG
jgi:hypothetical protein